MPEKDISDYADIINLQRPISYKRPPMPVIKRAAQFAPFAALTGHDEAIQKALQRHIAQALEYNI